MVKQSISYTGDLKDVTYEWGGGGTYYSEGKRQLLAQQKIGNNLGLPAQKWISGKQSTQRKECMLF